MIRDREPRKDRGPRINERIGVREVRVVGEDGDQLGVLETRDALAKAKEMGLDLVEVAPKSRPPVCRIMDFGKYKYELAKKQKQAKKKQHQVTVKEIKMRPKIETHDYEFKKKHAIEFLEHGDKVKFTITFRGREMAHTDLGAKILRQLAKELEDIAKIEAPPRQEGRQMVLLMTPLQSGKTKPQGESKSDASKKETASSTESS